VNRNPITMHISIRIQQQYPTSGYLVLENQLELDAQDFLEMSKILGQFQDLATRIKNEKGFTEKG
jgi:hypothetical protein